MCDHQNSGACDDVDYERVLCCVLCRRARDTIWTCSCSPSTSASHHSSAWCVRACAQIRSDKRWFRARVWMVRCASGEWTERVCMCVRVALVRGHHCAQRRAREQPEARERDQRAGREAPVPRLPVRAPSLVVVSVLLLCTHHITKLSMRPIEPEFQSSVHTE